LNDPAIERAAVAIHKRLARDHCICFLFHVHQRNWGHALLHFAVFLYDRAAVNRHAHRLKERES
jgi:hypothetical protein